MRIIKDLPIYHQDERYLDKESPIGELIFKLTQAIGNENEFLRILSSVKYWNYHRISLWAFEHILNEIDALLSKYKTDISSNETSLAIIFSFYQVILENTTNKDIFSSFDHLQDIFFVSRKISIKVEILEVYLLLLESRKSLNSFYLDFLDIGLSMIDLREYIIEILLLKEPNSIENNVHLLKGFEKILLGIQKDYKKISQGKLSGSITQTTSTPSKIKINDITPIRLFNYITNSKEYHSYSEISKEAGTNAIPNDIIKDYEYYTSYYQSKAMLKEEKTFKMLVDHVLIIISELYRPNDSNIPSDNINYIIKFVLILINIYITLSQKCKRNPLIITEYYIERYLKDVLAIVTSSNSLEVKSIFLLACISFINNLDGYESILFQNGLFHSILSDLTHQNETNLELLSYEESINQNFFNCVLVFLYKSSSFKEIPVHFLNKVLEVPKNNVYPFRIDNVIFSLKKKRIIDESTMKDLIIPRLLYELNNIYTDDSELSYLEKDDYHSPTVFERSNLISKIFKIIYLVYEQNNNITLLRAFEEPLTQSIISFLSNDLLITTRKYDMLFFSCAELLTKMCFIVPHKIPQFIESKGVDLFFNLFQNKIPKINGALNLFFQLIYSLSFHEEGKNYYLKDSHSMISNVIDKMFNAIEQDAYLHYNLISINELLDDDLYSPYISFLRIEGLAPVIETFFSKLFIYLTSIKEKIDALCLPENYTSIEINWVTFKVSKYIQTLLHFFVHISQEERDLLIENEKINFTKIVGEYYDLLFKPIVLYSISNTVLSSIIIKILSQNPDEFIKRVHDNFMTTLKSIRESSMSRIQKDKALITLFKNVDVSVKKIYPLVQNKSYVDDMMIEVIDIIKSIVKQQTNIRVCMGPINDFIFLIQGKHYYKFVSNTINPDLRQLIIKNTKELITSMIPTLLNPEVTIIHEDNYLSIYNEDVHNDYCRVEFMNDNNSFLYSDIVDPSTKLLLDILPILDFLITTGKNLKVKGLKEIKDTEISTITTWMNLAYLLTHLLKDLREQNEFTPNNRLEVITLYTHILNDINIIAKEKNFSSVVIFYFIKYGGIREIFLIVKNILPIIKEIKSQKKQLFIELLMIKLLWNVILTIMTNIINYDFEHQDGFYLILLKEDMEKFNIKSELSVYVKHLILNDCIEVFYNKENPNCSLTDMSSNDYNFNLLLFSIVDVSVTQFKNLLEIKTDEVKFKEIELMGFSKASIIQAIQEGCKKKDEIINYLLSPNKDENEDEDKEEQNQEHQSSIEANPNNNDNSNNEQELHKNKEPNKMNALKTNKKLELIPNLPVLPTDEFMTKMNKKNNMLLEEDQHRNSTHPYSRDNYNFNLSIIYSILSNDNVSKDKITQLRKMNLEYRIKEIQNETELISCLKQILILERENIIETTSPLDQNTLSKILNNKMHINYIIFKDRSKYNNFFEKLDVAKLSVFVEEFKILEMNLATIVYYSKIKVEDNSIILKIIYECFHMIYIVISFITHFKTEKNNSFMIQKEKYIDTFLTLLSNPNTMDQNIIVLVLTTMIQNFNNESIQVFVEKGGVSKLFQLRFNKANAYTTFNDNKFKTKVTLDETIRLFVFKLFIDDQSHQHLLKGIFKYIFSNNNETHVVNEIQMDDFLKVISEFVTNDMKNNITRAILEMCDIVQKYDTEKEEEDEDNEEDSDGKNDKEKEKKDDNNINKKEPFKSPKPTKKQKLIYYLRLKQQYQSQLDIILSELKIKEATELNIPNTEDQYQSPKTKEIDKDKIAINALSQSLLNSRKKTEDQIAKVSKIFSPNNMTVVNSLIKHIWKTCSEIEKEIDRNIHNLKFILERKYIVDLDAALISFSSLIHSFPGLLSVILKYHKQKEKISFISFLIKNIFYVLSFYNNCTLTPNSVKSNNELIEKLAKEKPEEIVKRLGTEVNSSQSVMEAYRNTNIITNLMQSLCYRRRNMDENEIFLIQKCRKKILNEINQVISEICLKKINEFNTANMTPNSNLPKSLIHYKSCINALFSLTEFHDESHIYSHMNPFEMSKMIFSKEYDIIKNICAIMKGLNLNNKTSCYFHKYTIKYYSEVFKYLRLNAKTKRETVIGKDNSENDDMNIEDNNIDDNDNLQELDIELHIEPNDEDDQNDNELEMMDDGSEDEDDEDSNLDESEEEDEMNGSSEMFYSLSSDNEFNDNEIDENENDNDNLEEDDIDFINSVPGSVFNFNANNNRPQLLNFIRNNAEEDEEEEEFDELSDNDSHQMQLQDVADVAVRFDEEGNAYVDQDRSDSQLDFDDNIMHFQNPRQIGFSNIRLNSFVFGQNGLVLDRNIMHRNNIINESRNNEILFHIPFLDSQMCNTELKYFFEDSLTFPFVINICHKDELLEFYICGIFVSLINRIGKNFVEKSTQIFQSRFINPFDSKSKRNLVMILIESKEKVYNAYLKEFNKLSEQFNYLDTEFTFVEDKEDMIKEIKDVLKKEENLIIEKPKENIKSKEKEKPKEEVNQIKRDEKNDIQLDNELFKEIPNELFNDVMESIDMKSSKNEIIEDKENSNKNQHNNSSNEKVISPIKEVNEPEQKNTSLKNPFLDFIAKESNNQKEKICNSNNNNNNNGNSNGDEKNNNNNNIDDNDNNNNNNDDNNNNNNNNNNVTQPKPEEAQVFDTQFIDGLPQDLREDILLNLDPSMVEHLSMPLLEEYNRLTDISPLFFFPENEQEEIQNNKDISHPIRRSSFKLEKIKFKIEDILLQQKHSKEHSIYVLNLFDDEFIENLLLFNVKYICESQPKCRINVNQYWILVIHLIQNPHLRHKILDLLLLFWICDSMCLRKLLQSPNCNDLLNKNTLLRSLNEIFIEESLPADFFIDDYDQFLQIFCSKFQKEMKKLFLETVFNNKGEYVLIENSKRYQMSKNSYLIKEILSIHFDEKENVLSNLLSLMLINSKTDIKKIFALKIFINIIQNCFKSNGLKNIISLRISNMTIEKIVDLFYNFETVLELSKGQISNNPSSLLCEMIIDHDFFSELLVVLKNHVEQLNIKVGIEMETFFTHQKIDINMFSKPLPENVLFKFVKLINLLNEAITKNYGDKEVTDNSERRNNIIRLLEDYIANPRPEEQQANQQNEEENNNNNEEIENKAENEGNNNNPNDKEKEEEKEKEKIKKQEENEKNTIREQYRKELNTVIKAINVILFKCWENLDLLLFEINKLLKDDQKIIVPKLNRLIPYLEAFITLSHLQFLQENSNCIQSKPFIIEKAYRSSPRKTPMKSLFYSPNGPYSSSFTDFFFKFCEKNKKVINLILRRYPKMFPNELMVKISNFLDLENKKKYFKCELKKLQTSREHLNLSIRRNELFQDSFSQLCFKTAEQIRSKITIHFEGEEGVDAGGVKREWITLLSKEMFNPNYMLFTLAKNGTTYSPNSDSGKFNTEHLRHFEFIGRIIAKAIYDGIMIDCYFTRSFYKIISNTPLTYHDMEDYDPEFYNSLKWLLENDITDLDVYLNYSFVHDNLGQIEIIDLIEDGRNIEVTEANKFDYVQKLCYAKLFDAIKPQIEAFLKGFYEIIPLKLIAIFDHRELELVISGLPTIDVNDLKQNTQYENYNEQSKVIKHFWEILENFDNDECAEFLQFVTGSSKVPLEGFGSLQGIGGVNKFKIAKVFETNYDRLPTAHTCTNQLDLPDYPSKEILQERLVFAIKEGKQGFGFI